MFLFYAEVNVKHNKPPNYGAQKKDLPLIVGTDNRRNSRQYPVYGAHCVAHQFPVASTCNAELPAGEQLLVVADHYRCTMG